MNPKTQIIPVDWLPPVQPIQIISKGALSRKAAMDYLSIGSTKLWQLEKTGQIKATVYGTYPVEILNEHLRKAIR